MFTFCLVELKKKNHFLLAIIFFMKFVYCSTDCPKKITIGIWVSIAKEPFMESEKSNRIMKLWLFSYNSVKTPSDLAK